MHRRHLDNCQLGSVLILGHIGREQKAFRTFFIHRTYRLGGSSTAGGTQRKQASSPATVASAATRTEETNEKPSCPVPLVLASRYYSLGAPFGLARAHGQPQPSVCSRPYPLTQVSICIIIAKFCYVRSISPPVVAMESVFSAQSLSFD